jgi:hypothetical protein
MKRVATRAATLGMKAHTGWAAAVAVARADGELEVVAKRRIDMATTFDEGAVYHVSQGLPLPRAEALIRAAQERFEALAREAIGALAAELRGAGLELVASAIVAQAARPLPPLERILRSHALVHAAEGALYRGVVARASEACSIPAELLPADELAARTARALGITPAQLTARLAALGKASGRPWAQDQKESALAACVALVARPVTSPRRGA